MSDQQLQYIRKASLTVTRPGLVGDSQASNIPDITMDLSAMRFQFQMKNQDDEGPTNCSIRVWNLKPTTVEELLKYNYSKVVVQGGYEGTFGVVFSGDIKQFRTGKTNQTDTYLDILAADGDLAYNYAVMALSMTAGTPASDRVKAIVKSFENYGVLPGQIDTEGFGGTFPRGVVRWGMARAKLRAEIETAEATWSIQSGKVQIIPLDGYLPGEVVELNSGTGLIGRPEQTQDGIIARCLMNPKIVVGGRVRINNALINQTTQQTPGPGALPYNQWTGIQILADVATDGMYRVYAAEHQGDTRGNDWYTDLICLAIGSDNKVKTP